MVSIIDNRIDYNKVGLWEASGAHPAKINPSTPTPLPGPYRVSRSFAFALSKLMQGRRTENEKGQILSSLSEKQSMIGFKISDRKK